MHTIRTWALFFTGFRQRLSSYSAGLTDLEHVFLCDFPGNAVRTRLFQWDEPVRPLADWLVRYLPPLGSRPHARSIVVVGYSYGGQTAADFCWELTRRGIRVDDLFLIDPVRRWKYAPGLAAATGLGTIRIPHSVNRVRIIVQRNPRYSFTNRPLFEPAGHKVARPDGAPIRPEAILGRRHTHMDEARGFRAEIYRTVADHHATQQQT